MHVCSRVLVRACAASIICHDVICQSIIFSPKVEQELLSYDSDTVFLHKHTWLEADSRRRNVHFNAQSQAIDANTTFQVNSLLHSIPIVIYNNE